MHPIRTRCAALLLSAALPLAAQAASTNLLLTLPGVKGSSLIDGYKGALNPTSFQWSATNEVVLSGEKRLGGKPEFSDLVWNQPVDTSMLGLMGYASTGTAKLDAVTWNERTGKLNPPYLTLGFDTPSVTGVHFGLATGGSQPEFEASLGASRYSVTYNPQGLGDGKTGSPVTVTFDRAKNTTLGADTRAAAPLQGRGLAFDSTGDRIFLRLGSDKDKRVIAGDSQVGGWQNWIELDSAQFGMSRPLSLVAGKLQPGALTLDDLSWSQRLDSSLPAILANLGKGSGLSEAVIEYVRGGERPRTLLQLSLKDVVFTSVVMQGDEDGLPSIEGSMNFSGFTSTVFTENPMGALEATSRTYDAKTRQFTDGKLFAAGLNNFGAGLQGFSSVESDSAESYLPPPAPANPVPEPQTWALWLLGIGVLVGSLRHRRA